MWLGVSLLAILILAVLAWWSLLPRTPRELFLTRCSSCHELRIARLCEFEPAVRPAIVDVMRHEHGADQVISVAEALMIQDYLKEAFQCP